MDVRFPNKNFVHQNKYHSEARKVDCLAVTKMEVERRLAVGKRLWIVDNAHCAGSARSPSTFQTLDRGLSLILS